MLNIIETRDVEEPLIVNIGSSVDGVSNSSPAFDTINRITDVRASGEGERSFYDIYSNISGLNRSPCGSSQDERCVVRVSANKPVNVNVKKISAVPVAVTLKPCCQ